MKTFSHRRSNFPSYRVGVGTVVQEWAGEFEADQMVAFGVGYAHGSSTQVARGSGKRIVCSERGTGDLEQNLRGERQRAAHGNQRSTGADIQGRGKFQEFFPLLIAAAHEYGDCQRQTWPAPSFSFQLPSVQFALGERELTLSLPHLRGQTPLWGKRALRCRKVRTRGTGMTTVAVQQVGSSVFPFCSPVTSA